MKTAVHALVTAITTLLVLGTLVAVFAAVSETGIFKASSGSGGYNKLLRMNAHARVNATQVNVTFDDVAGMDEAKVEIMEFVDFLKNADRFWELGANMPRGALLSGPPGTGKTLLARAIAGEAGVPFYTLSGSDLNGVVVGVGGERVRNLFREARAHAPCIVFIDEIDAMGGKRGSRMFQTSNDGDSTLNQLLVEMDGFAERTNIIVLASTNRRDMLDPALLRAGRFDRHIAVSLPDTLGRTKILEVHLRKIKLEGDAADFAVRLARFTAGFSGADIRNVCNEAAIAAVRRGLPAVTLPCFEEAMDRVRLSGVPAAKKLVTEEDRRTVAYHEAGHAVAAWYLEHAEPPLKVTIVPRGGQGGTVLGYTQSAPDEGRAGLRTRAHLDDALCVLLAGRAGEASSLGAVTTGAQSDLRRATELAYALITQHGMGKQLGHMAFRTSDEGPFGAGRQLSEHMARLVDEEVKSIMDNAYERGLTIMAEHREQLEALAEQLLDKETIYQNDLEELLGARPVLRRGLAVSA